MVPPLPLTVVIAADGNFSIPLALCVESLLASARKETRYNIHILDDGVRAEVREYLQGLQKPYGCTITHHDVSHAVEGMESRSIYPKVAFARFLFDTYLPPDMLGRVFYSDADVLFCDDLTPLFQMDMGGCTLAARQELNLISRERYEYLQHWAGQNGVDMAANPGAYFLSGNILIDTDKWKEHQYGSQILARGLSEDAKKLSYPDQDIMNAVCWGDIAAMPARYCVVPLFANRYDRAAYDSMYEGRCLYSADELEQAIRNPAVLHFAGVKPQVLLGPHYAGEERFIDFWKRSAWRDYLPYAPQRGTQGADLFLDTGRKLSEQLGGLRKRALKYSILRYLVWGGRRARYKTWATGLAGILKAMKS